MSEVVIVHRATSSVEAEALRGWLSEQDIECRIDDPRDTAYPGILDRGRRWNLLVAASDEDAAREAIEAWNAAELAGGDGPYRGDAEPEKMMTGPTSSQRARKTAAKRFVFGALIGSSVCANFYLSLTNYALERDYLEELRNHGADLEIEERRERVSVQNTAALQYQHRLDLETERVRLERCQIDLARVMAEALPQ